MKKTITGCLLLICLMGISVKLEAASKSRQYRFWIEFTDKKFSNYSLLKPWDFLSQRALDRRNRVGYTVNMQDIPVTKRYVDTIATKGVRVLLISRWMNAVLVSSPDSVLSADITSQYFVGKTSLVGIYNLKRGFAEERPGAALDYSMLLGNEEEKISVKNNVSEKEFNEGYGLGWDQISQINGQALHRAGYRGNGIQIAVLDAGFYRANLMSAFDSLFKTKNFLGSYDLVDGGNNVFNDDDHGTQVLSCMASNAPGVMVGTAPEASYLLIRTEDAGAEMPCEEINWLCGAELADSAGVDIISSSLGYTEFDDSRFGHHYNELNGNTTIITRAANMAWDRGILIVNSAGNEGDGKWKHIGAPADAFGVIAIGAVDRHGDLADFSSVGPTADNRVKPDLVALGKNTTVINSNGYFIHSDGTSFSAPVLAGALACFLQYDGFENPVKTRNLLLLSAQHTLHADNQTGKGLPDMELAMKLSKHDTTVSSVNPFINWPDNDTLTQAFELKTVRKPSTSYQYKLKNNLGFTLESGILFPYEGVLFAASLEPKDKGFYKLEITDGADKWNCKFYFATPKKSKKNEKAR